GIFTKLEFENAQAIATVATDLFVKGEYDRVEIIYNEFKNVASQKPSAYRVLPVLDTTDTTEKDTATDIDYIYEPEPASILEVLVPKHLETLVWTALLESNAAEQGARMTAMD